MTNPCLYWQGQVKKILLVKVIEKDLANIEEAEYLVTLKIFNQIEYLLDEKRVK